MEEGARKGGGDAEYVLRDAAVGEGREAGEGAEGAEGGERGGRGGLSYGEEEGR